MKKIKLVLISITLLFLSQCGFITILPPAQWENADDFKVSYDTKPSELLKKFIGNKNVTNVNQNYCITFFDIYCGQSQSHFNICNSLYEETQENYQWFAITVYDSISYNKVRKKLGISEDSLKYKYPTFYSIIGLRSSMRNLFYNNNIPDEDISTLTFIIYNDTISRITRGIINTEEKYLEHKNLLDSLSQK